MSRLPFCAVALAVALPASAWAGEVMYQFRTEEDPKAPVDPAACQVAPFQANVQLQGIISVPEMGAADAKVRPGSRKRVGTARLCVRITDRTFPEGSQADAYARFELPGGRFVAVGKCTTVSNAVPRPGVVLASCALKLTEFPPAYAGGFATSASIFNPLKLPGYGTGSLWTLRVFEPDPAAAATPGGAGREPVRAPPGDKAPPPASPGKSK
jgi:hypothetical protein